MKLDVLKASSRLSELEIIITADHLLVEVLWFRVMPVEPGSTISRHTHSSYEFHFIQQGACKVVLDDGEFDVQAGEFYLTAPGVYHEQRFPYAKPCFEYSLNCDLKLLDDKITEAFHWVRLFTDYSCRVVGDHHGSIDYFSKALEEAYFRNLGYHSNIRNLVFLILSTAARSLGGNNTPYFEVPVIKKKGDFRFAQIEKYVQDNVFTPITTRDIAHIMFLSEKQVCRTIKDQLGISTKEYMMKVKLTKAKELLLTTDHSIQQISESLGFSSEYYFSQFFKRKEGIPPSAYRNS